MGFHGLFVSLISAIKPTASTTVDAAHLEVRFTYCELTPVMSLISKGEIVMRYVDTDTATSGIWR